VSGRVYLVGAGPGDPGLITVRGAQCLARAEVVLYDSLANAKLLGLAPQSAELVLVGKRHGRVSVSQEKIESMLVAHAQAGRVVVRLKGGDPFIFGRGGEEAEACRRAGVDFEVVPGVSSAIAVPAAAGIPLTHREHASSVTFITGTPGELHEQRGYDWDALVRTRSTLVFLMGLLRAREISQGLLDAGMPGQTAVAAVRWGTTPRQQTLRSTLAELAERIEASGLRPPVVLVIGAVAELADHIAWYERLPLFGRRIVVTRARSQSTGLAERLEALGAEAVNYPVIEVREVEDEATRRQVEAAFAAIADYDWLVLTSVNGVERFFSGFLQTGRDIRDLAGVKLAAIGPATAAALEKRGVRVAVQPSEYRAEALLEALGDVAGSRILLARALVAREVLPEELRRRGARVDVIATYRTVAPEDLEAPSSLGEVDMVTFTSSSTVSNFAAAAGDGVQEFFAATSAAAIGPITAASLRDIGVEPALIAEDYTVDGLVDSILGYFAKQQGLE